MRVFAACPCALATLALACDAIYPPHKAPPPLNGAAYAAACYVTPCAYVQSADVGGPGGVYRLAMDANGNLTLPCDFRQFYSSDVGWILCDNCGPRLYESISYYCVASSQEALTAATMAKNNCITDSDIDPNVLGPSRSNLPTYQVVPYAGTGWLIPLVGYFGIVPIINAGSAYGKARYFGPVSNSGGCSASVELLGQVLPNSTVIQVDQKKSYAVASDGHGHAVVTGVSGSVSVRSDCSATCPLHFDNITLMLDSFSIDNITLTNTSVNGHGLFDALPGSNALYTLPASALFDISTKINGTLTGFGKISPDSPGAVAFDGTHFGLSLSVNSRGLAISITVIGETANAPPKAIAKAPPVVECSEYGGSHVELDGSASTDPENDVVSYSWSENGRILAMGSSAKSTVFLTLGTHHIVLTVSDSAGRSDQAWVDVTVVDSTPPTLVSGGPTVCVWPPDDQLTLYTPADLGVSAIDVCDPSPKVFVTKVTGPSDLDDDPDNAEPVPGVLAGATAICLPGGDEGTYLVHLVTVDASCNQALGDLRVAVVDDPGEHNGHEPGGRKHKGHHEPEPGDDAPCKSARNPTGSPVPPGLGQCISTAEVPTCSRPAPGSGPSGCSSGSAGWLALLGPLFALWRRHRG